MATRCLVASGMERDVDEAASAATTATAAGRRPLSAGTVVKLRRFWERQRGDACELPALPNVCFLPVNDELIGGSRLALGGSPRAASGRRTPYIFLNIYIYIYIYNANLVTFDEAILEIFLGSSVCKADPLSPDKFTALLGGSVDTEVALAEGCRVEQASFGDHKSDRRTSVVGGEDCTYR